jgi:hypothetical protein
MIDPLVIVVVRAAREFQSSLAARIKCAYKFRMSTDARTKSKRGRPPVDSEEVRARMERPTLDALDAYIAAHPEPRPSRSEAIRRLLGEALASGPPEIKSAALLPKQRAAELVRSIAALVDELVEPAAKAPLPPPSDAFLRAKAKARKVRLRKAAK